MKTILVMGPQGSGKSTQAKLLAKRIGMQFLSVGEALRSYAKVNEGGISYDLKGYMNKGELVPHGIAQMVVSLFILDHPNEKGYVIDGYPRAIEQYNDYKNLFEELPRVVFVLELEEDVIMDRINKRKILEHRKDETKDAILRRLEIYRTQTQIVLETARSDNVPIEYLDGNAPVDDVHHKLYSLYEKKYHV